MCKPIVTVKDGDTITKVCTEDVYKIVNRIYEAMDKAYNNSVDILNSIHKEYDDYEGELIIGTGISKPCANDEFNDEVGNRIAFEKAKLNANIKKHNFILRVMKEFTNCVNAIKPDLKKIDEYIKFDLHNLRTYNDDYLKGIESKLGIS
jgi:hypothetical protein